MARHRDRVGRVVTGCDRYAAFPLRSIAPLVAGLRILGRRSGSLLGSASPAAS